MQVGRFAPSTTGDAHPGTLLAALLAWLDIRGLGGRFILRLEDLDPDRCKPENADQMRRALEWMGLDWDQCELQSEHGDRHAQALDALFAQGLLYPCRCSRSQIKARAKRADDGSFIYDDRCRGESFGEQDWRSSASPIRLKLPDEPVDFVEEGKGPQSVNARLTSGDPVVRRRDGAVAYNLAVVVDDIASGVTRVVRGNDISSSTALQVGVYQRLGKLPPIYRHHLLLLETQGQKLAKFHGSVGWQTLKQHYSQQALLGFLAYGAGLQNDSKPTTIEAIQACFSWARVRADDLELLWRPPHLSVPQPKA